MKRLTICILVFFISSFFFVPKVMAGYNDPRDSLPAPGGTDLFIFYYRNYSGDEYYQDGDKLDNNIDFNYNMGMARYGHYWDLGD